MNTSGVLDDYLQELLLDASAAPACPAPAPAIASAPPGRSSPAVIGIQSVADAPAAPAVMEVAAAAAPMPSPVKVPAAEIARTPPSAAPPPMPVIARSAAAGNNAWNELQAQARQAPREQQRRAAERTSRWLRLRCGAQAYALELLKVQEVVLPVPLLALRGAGNSMLGIMNLRGQVVPVIDLGIHLGAGAIDSDAHTRIVVLEEAGETLGLRVSAVEDVTSLTDSQIEPPDTTRICQISNDLFKGIARLAQRPMILLDASRLLH